MTKLLRDVAEGSIVKLKESGSPVEFYVAKHDYESKLNGEGRTLLVRANGGTAQKWNNSNVTSEYATSDIDAFLNTEYKALLDVAVQEKIDTTAFYYTPSYLDPTISVLNRSVFLLSVAELGIANSSSTYNIEGSALPEASTLRNLQTYQWTRTPCLEGGGKFHYVWLFNRGSLIDWDCQNQLAARAAFTLDAATTCVLDDGTIVFDVPTISGEDADLGTIRRRGEVAYTVTAVNGSDITVTEAVNDTIIRTYTATSGEAQTMEVSTEGLALGQHTVAITAEIDGVTAERYYTFTIPAVWLTHGETDLGDKTGNFTIPFVAESFSGNDVTITEALDGEVQRTYTAQSGAEQGMSIGMKSVIDGAHSATITAECGENIARAIFTFNVPAIALHDGGTVQEFQDENGDPVFPATLARAVFTTGGQSVERALTDLKSRDISDAYAWLMHAPSDSPYTIGNVATVKVCEGGPTDSAYQISGSWSVQYADEVEVSSDGALVLVNPTSVTFGVSNTSGPNVLKGKFWTWQTGMYYTAESDAGATYDWACVGMYFYFYAYMTARTVTLRTAEDDTLLGVVFDQDSEAYPADGEQNGVHYTRYGKLIDQLASRGTRMQTTYYTGTGTYGTSNRCSLTFDFVPKVVFILPSEGFTSISSANYFPRPWVNPCTVGVLSYHSSSYMCNLTWNDKTLSWYGSNAQYQQNVSGVTYRVVALG